MNRRTDLALEARELREEQAQTLPQVESRETQAEGFPLTTVTVTGILESTRYEKSPAAIRLPAMKPGEEKKLEQRIDLGNIVLLPQAAGLTAEGELWVRLAWEGEEGRRQRPRRRKEERNDVFRLVLHGSSLLKLLFYDNLIGRAYHRERCLSSRFA